MFTKKDSRRISCGQKKLKKLSIRESPENNDKLSELRVKEESRRSKQQKQVSHDFEVRHVRQKAGD